jgi:hypothetical protein
VTPREAIEAAELAEAETAYRHQLAREMYQAGQRAGFQAGYRQAEADQAAEWAKVARPVVHGISHAELEERRWGPGGRAHFADPRPGDFPGRAAQPQTQPEAQREMCGRSANSLGCRSRNSAPGPRCR